MAKYKTKKERHPLYHTWAWMRRMATKNSMDKNWHQDFYTFVAEVGERPSPQHRLYRKDESKGYSKENCYWKEVITCDDKAHRQRVYRKLNPDKYKGYDLKRRLGMSLEQYNSLKEKQSNLCAICKQPEQFNGSLAVDHCHATGKVRGLLCTNCNRGLGHFKDSTDNLRNAVEYLAA